MSGKWWILATVVILELVEIGLLLNRQKRRLIATLLYVEDKNRAFVNVARCAFSRSASTTAPKAVPRSSNGQAPTPRP